MIATPTSRPTPLSSRNRLTPSAAASPKALPPVNSRACLCASTPVGCRPAVPRVSGEEPRASMPTTVARSKRTAVHPVAPAASVAWPTSTPGTSQRLSSTPALRVRTYWRFWQLPLFGIGGYDAGIIPGQGAEGDQFLIGALGAELDEDGVFDHGVVDDLTLPIAELHGGVAVARKILEIHREARRQGG